MLTDFNGTSTCLGGSFYAYRLENCILCIWYQVFLSITNDMQTSIWPIDGTLTGTTISGAQEQELPHWIKLHVLLSVGCENIPSPTDKAMGWGEILRGVVDNVLDCDIEVSKFELKLHYKVQFRTNPSEKSMNFLILPPSVLQGCL